MIHKTVICITVGLKLAERFSRFLSVEKVGYVVKKTNDDGGGGIVGGDNGDCVEIFGGSVVSDGLAVFGSGFDEKEGKTLDFGREFKQKNYFGFFDNKHKLKSKISNQQIEEESLLDDEEEEDDEKSGYEYETKHKTKNRKNINNTQKTQKPTKNRPKPLSNPPRSSRISLTAFAYSLLFSLSTPTGILLGLFITHDINYQSINISFSDIRLEKDINIGNRNFDNKDSNDIGLSHFDNNSFYNTGGTLTYDADANNGNKQDSNQYTGVSSLSNNGNEGGNSVGWFPREDGRKEIGRDLMTRRSKERVLLHRKARRVPKIKGRNEVLKLIKDTVNEQKTKREINKNLNEASETQNKTTTKTTKPNSIIIKTSVILQALATGSFFYVNFFEILLPQLLKSNGEMAFLDVVCCVVGWGLLVVLRAVLGE